MTSLTYMDSKIVIDKCNTCKGVWLDKNGFDKIIKYLEKKVISESSSEYAKDTLKEFQEIFNGPESKVSELKDFLAVINLFQMRLAVENPWVTQISQNWPIR